MPTGQPDLDSPSLRFSSKEILGPDMLTKLTVTNIALHGSEFLIFLEIFFLKPTLHLSTDNFNQVIFSAFYKKNEARSVAS